MSIKNEYQQHNFLSNTGFGTVSPTEKVDVTGNINLSTGNTYKINGSTVLSNNTLGSSVTSSSLTSLGTLSTLTVSGDATFDTSTLKVDSTNNRVGIGSATPVGKLDIIGSTEALYVDSQNTTGSFIRLHNNGSSSEVGAAIHRFGSAYAPSNAYGPNILNLSNWSADMTFEVDTAQNFRFHNDTSEIVRITGSGNVGIGTTNPSSKLHLSGPNNGAGVAGSAITILGDGATPSTNLNAPAIYHRAYVGLGLWADLRMSFQVNGGFTPIEAMRIAENGNVGIGTTTPSTTLDVNGTVSKTGGSFDIVHPDPVKAADGYRLRHCFVEAPTRGDNMYRFKVNTVNKEATITLPDYYQHLNENTQIWISAEWNTDGYGRGRLNPDNSSQIDIRVSTDGEYNVLIIGTRKDQAMIDYFDAKGVEYKKESTNITQDL
jgi:hypothetical protein